VAVDDDGHRANRYKTTTGQLVPFAAAQPLCLHQKEGIVGGHWGQAGGLEIYAVFLRLRSESAFFAQACHWSLRTSYIGYFGEAIRGTVRAASSASSPRLPT